MSAENCEFNVVDIKALTGVESYAFYLRIFIYNSFESVSYVFISACPVDVVSVIGCWKVIIHRLYIYFIFVIK